MPIHPQRGVTLVELMIAMLIVAVLAGIATPSYRQYIRKAERQKGAECVMDIHKRMQVFNQSRGNYPTLLTALGLPPNPGDTIRCADSDYVVSLEAYDRLSAADCPAVNGRYQLRATPSGAQQPDGALVLGFCTTRVAERQLIRDRMVGSVKKPWTD